MIGAALLLALQQLPPPDDNLPVSEPDQLAPANAVGRVETGSLASIFELNLTVVIFLFGLLALILLYLINANHRTTPFVMRIFIITILIFGSLLVVSSAFTTEQISPVIGFFGTIAGYILGRGDLNNEIDETRRADKANKANEQ